MKAIYSSIAVVSLLLALVMNGCVILFSVHADPMQILAVVWPPVALALIGIGFAILGRDGK